jgi:non-ribosomal peptide synthetase-like protein
MYAAALGVETLLPVAASLPALALIAALSRGTQMGVLTEMIITAPLIVASFFITYALLVALFFRAVSLLVRPGWHADEGGTAWALWFSQNLLEGASSLLFPLYSSLLTRPWLRLLGIPVGRGTEMSHATTLTRLTSLGETSFGADEPGFATARLRRGWLHVDPIQVGNGTFLGNGALLTGGTRLGDHSLVGVLSSAPKTSADGSSWFGHPPLELPRVPDEVDPARTTNPPRRLFVGRGAAELVRILLPGSLSVMLAALAFTALDAIGTAAGPWIMIVAAPFVVLAGGLCAAALTIALKWLVMGRYRPGNHPFWSFFVWRDEIINSCQEQLAGAWLLRSSLGTPVISAYLRAMGARVGSDVWCETLAITEFDLVDLHDGCVVNRLAHVQTHLFQDRLLRIGPTTLEAGSTLGPSSAVLPDTRLGAGCSVGGRSVVLRGEELPAGTRWHGAPVVGV